MNNKETFEEFIDKLCDYTQEDYEGDLKLINILETKKLHKSFVDFLKWKTSNYVPKMKKINSQ